MEPALKLPSRARVAALPGEPHIVRLAADGDVWGNLGSYGWGQGHQAADQSIARGLVYFPELDTKKEITSYTRTEILRKVRFLYANVGLCRRIVNGVARMVAGTGLMPSPRTRDREWNKLADARLEAVYNSAQTFDLAGKFTGWRSQRARLKCHYRDGDLGTVLTRNDDGRATVAFFEGHQIGSGRLAADDHKSVFDGVRVNRHNRALGYHLLRDDGSHAEVPAASFLLLANQERMGQTRGLSILSHGVPHLLDRTEIKSYFKGSIKNAARIGYYIGASKDSTPPAPPRPGAGTARTTVTTATGQKVNLDKVFSGIGGQVEQLDPGQEIKVLLDERPHPNTLGLLDELVRDISLGIDLHPEIIWNIVKLGGANIRYVMQDAQSFVESEQQTLIDTTLAPEYLWFLADEIASGRLPPCPDPEWWRHAWITPARWTVDIGRDGKLHLEQLRSAALTFRRFFGWQGLGLDEIDEWMDEMKYIREGALARGLDPDKVTAAIYGRPSIPVTAEKAEPSGPASDDDDDS